MIRTITVNYHNLPSYLRKEALAQQKRDLPDRSFSDVLQGKVLFCLSCPENPWKENRQLVGITCPSPSMINNPQE